MKHIKTFFKHLFSLKMLLYMLRWQMSTPILAIVLYILNFGTLVETIIANFIGSIIFFFVDRIIFRNKNEVTKGCEHCDHCRMEQNQQTG